MLSLAAEHAFVLAKFQTVVCAMSEVARKINMLTSQKKLYERKQQRCFMFAK